MGGDDGVAPGVFHVGGQRRLFRVWAPFAERVEVRLLGERERMVPLKRDDRGYHEAVVEDVVPGALYRYRLNGSKELPDPASRSQPQGVRGPSQVIAPTFEWTDAGWAGLPLRDYVIYELHVGTFTDSGTFDGVIPQLDYLRDLGVTAIELMPVAQFPGGRNWGYDGVYPYAAQSAYGGVDGLRRLVNACHERGLAVVLDVVYNHLGPERNYLGEYGPYFTDRYRTPWGLAINFDGPDSDEVRNYFVYNALYWVTECHIDALRLDAVHAILDHSARTFLRDLADAVRERSEELGRRIYTIAESDQNDPRLVAPPELGGYGLSAQWSDDFHHALHTLLTGERDGYYLDFGSVQHLARAYTSAFVYQGQPSKHRRRRHGAPIQVADGRRFVVCAQNHDQIGNRMLGERLTVLLDFERLKLAAGATLLSPFVPLLFMGEEYGETAPFLYFISHEDPDLVEAVRKGRKEEFAAFAWRAEPPDPQSPETFERSTLDHELRRGGRHKILLELHRELLSLRREVPALGSLSLHQVEAVPLEGRRVLAVRRWNGHDEVVAFFNFGESRAEATLAVSQGTWYRLLDSSDRRWDGPGASTPETAASDGTLTAAVNPGAFVLLQRGEES